MTISTENFVKAIYSQSKLSAADTRLGTLAGLLNVTNAAATEMARKLAAKELVNYTRYKPVTLTQKGNRLALNVLRKHRLWESFLYKTLNLSLHEIHREAEILEHLTSDFLADRIDSYLGNPKCDPHGDPIPENNGKITMDRELVLLSEALPGHVCQVYRLSGSEKGFFEFCTSCQITPGSTLLVGKQYDSPKMTEISINKNRILLGKEFTDAIHVKRVK